MLSLSQPAVLLVWEVARKAGAEPALRIRVLAGGCSGLTWDWVIGEVGEQPGDLKRTTDGVTVVVDPQSASYVRGATVDVGPLQENGLRPALDPATGRTLVLKTLTGARNLCGCGESFAP